MIWARQVALSRYSGKGHVANLRVTPSYLIQMQWEEHWTCLFHFLGELGQVTQLL